ncbi:MAG TPA: hypothetical protein VEF90_12560 [Xanthobacteraceae bacterium]|nr:hypothetical protein [Xanthobacteraceae bacterium]
MAAAGPAWDWAAGAAGFDVSVFCAKAGPASKVVATSAAEKFLNMGFSFLFKCSVQWRRFEIAPMVEQIYRCRAERALKCGSRNRSPT